MSPSEDQAEAMAGSGVHLAYFFRLDTLPTVRLWSGAGDFPVSADAIEPDGATYKGMGTLQGIPSLSALINGVAERVAFTLSGIPSEVMALADGEAGAVRNRTVNVGILPLGADLQPIGNVLWFRAYEADVLSVDKGSNNDGAITRTVSLSVGSAFTARKRPLISNWTDVDQKRRSDDDLFCERTPFYSQGTTITWPRF